MERSRRRLVFWVRPFKKRPPAGACFEGQYLPGGRGSQGRLVTGRACHFEKKKLRSDGFASFLSFFVFCAAFLSGSFWGISPSAEGDQGLALDLPPFVKGGPKL